VSLNGYARARRREFAGKWLLERIIGIAVGWPGLIERVVGRMCGAPELADLLFARRPATAYLPAPRWRPACGRVAAVTSRGVDPPQFRR